MKNNTGNYFEINKDTPVVIYGAAAAGLRGYHSLKTINHYNVVGFFDKRADEIVIQCGLPVWSPKLEIPYKKEECSFIEYQYKMCHTFKKGIRANLAALGKENDIEHNYDKLHDALVDLELNIKVWDKLKWRIEI